MISQYHKLVVKFKPKKRKINFIICNNKSDDAISNSCAKQELIRYPLSTCVLYVQSLTSKISKSYLPVLSSFSRNTGVWLDLGERVPHNVCSEIRGNTLETDMKLHILV